MSSRSVPGSGLAQNPTASHIRTAQDDGSIEFIGQKIDRKRGVTTKYYFEPPGAPGPRRNSMARHLIVRSSDGRPETATRVPNKWTADDLLAFINGIIRPQSSQEFVYGGVGCHGLDEDIFE
jgi:hypothetical protein